MKKFIPILVALVLICGLLTIPTVLASTESGTGQNRSVVLSNPYTTYTNATVTVPTILNNESANSFAYVITDTSNSTINYTVNISVEYNGTYYNKTVAGASVANDSTTLYTNYTADEVPVGEANVTIQLVFTDNYTEADNWTGTIDYVAANTYAISVTTIGIILSLIPIAVIILFIGKIFGSIQKQMKKD